MANAEKPTISSAIAADGYVNSLEDQLKPFQRRMTEAEERLARLEAVLAAKSGQNGASEELSAVIKDLQSKLEMTQQEQKSDREKASKEIQKLTAENAKLHYRITHLVRALKDANYKLQAPQSFA